jgi:quercetin dioxygenase-like cupin family protein
MKDGAKVVLFALDQGQEISPHLSPFPASVVLLSGHMQVQVGPRTHDVLPHEEVAFPMGHPHGLKALAPSHFMLVMKRAVKDPATLRFHQVPLPGAGAESVSCACAD